MGCPAECHQFVDEMYFGNCQYFEGDLSQRMLNTHQGQNDLEKVGEGHSPQNSSERFPRCTCKLNLKKLGPFAGDLSRTKANRLHFHALEKVGLGHPSSNLSETYPNCICKLNLKKLGPFAGDLSHTKANRWHVHAFTGWHDLEKVGQGHPSSNLSETFPKCICKLNLMKLGPFAGDLSRTKANRWHLRGHMTLKSRPRSSIFELVRDLPKMHL